MKHPYHDIDDSDEDLGPSKSELKRQSAQRQTLGERLMDLDESHWAKLPLTDEMLRSLEESRRIKSHEGMRRHRQYIGKLMRQEDTDAISHYLSTLETHRELNTRAFHALETTRERLIRGGNGVIGEVLARHPTADSQKLRQLVRDAKKEHEANQTVKHARELFRYLRSLEENDAVPFGDE